MAQTLAEIRLTTPHIYQHWSYPHLVSTRTEAEDGEPKLKKSSRDPIHLRKRQNGDIVMVRSKSGERNTDMFALFARSVGILPDRTRIQQASASVGEVIQLTTTSPSVPIAHRLPSSIIKEPVSQEGLPVLASILPASFLPPFAYRLVYRPGRTPYTQIVPTVAEKTTRPDHATAQFQQVVSQKVDTARFGDIVLPLPVIKHICAGCGQYRSRKFQCQNPLQPGQRPPTAYCRKCQRVDTSTDFSSEDDQCKGIERRNPKKKPNSHEKLPKRGRQHVCTRRTTESTLRPTCTSRDTIVVDEYSADDEKPKRRKYRVYRSSRAPSPPPSVREVFSSRMRKTLGRARTVFIAEQMPKYPRDSSILPVGHLLGRLLTPRPVQVVRYSSKGSSLASDKVRYVSSQERREQPHTHQQSYKANPTRPISDAQVHCYKDREIDSQSIKSRESSRRRRAERAQQIADYGTLIKAPNNLELKDEDTMLQVQYTNLPGRRRYSSEIIDDRARDLPHRQNYKDNQSSSLRRDSCLPSLFPTSPSGSHTVAFNGITYRTIPAKSQRAGRYRREEISSATTLCSTHESSTESRRNTLESSSVSEHNSSLARDRKVKGSTHAAETDGTVLSTTATTNSYCPRRVKFAQVGLDADFGSSN